MRRRDKLARRLVAVLAAIVLAPSVTAAAELAPQRSKAAREYRACMQLARKDARAAEARAATWHADGGGAPAMHCLSVALLGLGQYEQAARNFEAMGRDEGGLRAALRADLLGQAGNAWMIAGKPDAAYAAQTDALALKPDDPGLLVDRAITLAATGQHWEALDDLNRALEIAPRRIEALVFRAGAWRNLGSLELAAEDIARALALAPDRPEALLERGLIRKGQGKTGAARADWLRVVELAPDGPFAEAARANLERMDVRTR